MKMQGKSVLILPDQLPEKTKRGLFIPKTAKELQATGVVVDCGPECENVYKGARLIFNRKAASIIKIDDVVHLITTDEENKIIFIYG